MLFKVSIAKRLPRGVVEKLRSAVTHKPRRGKGAYRRDALRRQMQRDMDRLS